MVHWVHQVIEPKRLYLAWQASDQSGDRFRWAIGELLKVDDTRLSLRYFQEGTEFKNLNQGRDFSEAKALGYAGHPAFTITRSFHTEGVSQVMFRRLPPRSRPDFSQYKEQFRLPPDLQISDFALLGHTEAKLPGDGFSVVDPLYPEASECDLLLEVAGYRYYAASLKKPLTVGSTIQVLTEPDNVRDAHAIKFCFEGQKVGNINRLQTSAFNSWIGKSSISAVVDRINGIANRPRVLVFIQVRNVPSQVVH